MTGKFAMENLGKDIVMKQVLKSTQFLKVDGTGRHFNMFLYQNKGL